MRPTGFFSLEFEYMVGSIFLLAKKKSGQAKKLTIVVEKNVASQDHNNIKCVQSSFT